MPIKTISQLRLDIPTITLTGSDLMMVDQSARTVAASLQQLKEFVRPADASTIIAGLMTSADKARLNGIENEATKNNTDVHLLSRDNHTGTQGIGSITDLQDILDTKLETVEIGTVIGLIDALASKLEGADIDPLNDRITLVESDKLDAENPTPTGSIAFPTYDIASVPLASAHNGRYIEITGAPGIFICRSNGTEWVSFSGESGTVIATDPAP